MNKTAFVISIVLTTFVLMAFGGIVYALRTPEAAAATETVQEEVVAADPTADPSLEQTLLEREAIYQQRIAEANARIEQVQQQLAAQTALTNPQANSQAALAPITAEQAAQIASDYLGGVGVYWVDIVTLQGEDLYEVMLTTGETMYINMAGQVVGSAPAQVAGSGGGGGGGMTMTSFEGSDQNQDQHDGDHDDEHEDEDHGSEGGDD
jgi:hypothetical protein